MTQEPKLNQLDPAYDAAADHEAIASDDAWSALAQLLDAAQADFDLAPENEAALVGRVLRRVSRRRRVRKRLLAAAVLLACGGAAWFSARGARIAAPAPARPILVARAADWDDDGLGLELAWVQHQAADLESQWRRPSDKLAFVRQQMDVLEAEFAGDSL